MAALEESDMARLQLDISEEVKTRLKLQAVREAVTMSELAERALDEYLSRVEQGQQKAAKGK